MKSTTIDDVICYLTGQIDNDAERRRVEQARRDEPRVARWFELLGDPAVDEDADATDDEEAASPDATDILRAGWEALTASWWEPARVVEFASDASELATPQVRCFRVFISYAAFDVDCADTWVTLRAAVLPERGEPQSLVLLRPSGDLPAKELPAAVSRDGIRALYGWTADVVPLAAVAPPELYRGWLRSSEIRQRLLASLGGVGGAALMVRMAPARASRDNELRWASHQDIVPKEPTPSLPRAARQSAGYSLCTEVLRPRIMAGSEYRQLLVGATSGPLPATDDWPSLAEELNSLSNSGLDRKFLQVWSFFLREALPPSNPLAREEREATRERLREALDYARDRGVSVEVLLAHPQSYAVKNRGIQLCSTSEDPHLKPRVVRDAIEDTLQWFGEILRARGAFDKDKEDNSHGLHVYLGWREPQRYAVIRPDLAAIALFTEGHPVSCEKHRTIFPSHDALHEDEFHPLYKDAKDRFITARDGGLHYLDYFRAFFFQLHGDVRGRCAYILGKRGESYHGRHMRNWLIPEYVASFQSDDTCLTDGKARIKTFSHVLSANLVSTSRDAIKHRFERKYGKMKIGGMFRVEQLEVRLDERFFTRVRNGAKDAIWVSTDD